MNVKRLLGVLVLLAIALPMVSADQYTLINITMTEIFHRNVSFADDYALVENTTYSQVIGEINITNPSIHTVYGILVTLESTSGLVGNITYVSGRNSSEYNSSIPGLPYYVFVPELRANDSTLLNYTVSGSAVNEPLNLSTDYSLNPFTQKMVAGDNFTIQQNVVNQDTGENTLTNVNITMRAQAVNWSNASNTVFTNFSLNYLNQSDDWTNVTQYTNLTWSWTPNDGTIAFNITYNITFNMSSPFSVPHTDTYLMLLEELSYQIDSTSSNLTVTNVTAGARVNFSTSKRIVRPSSNVEDTNATWEASGGVGTPLNVSFQLNKVTIWVTDSFNPNVPANDSLNPTNRLQRNYTPSTEVNITNAWSTPTVWEFNFSDGTGGTPPPIVWMKPEYTIMYKNDQILNFTSSQNGTDLYLKYIYVISGYWLEINKNITNYAENNYSIRIRVENRGNQPTPKNLTVTVYDFIPYNFYNNSAFIPGFASSQSITGTGQLTENNFTGTVYQWDIPRSGPYNSSLLARGQPNSTYLIQYNVTGNGTYSVSDLYVVGLDPRQVDGAFASPLITIISGLQGHSKEILYLGIVLFLIILNVSNLVVSSRINKQIDSHPPRNMHEYQKLKDEIERLKKHINE